MFQPIDALAYEDRYVAFIDILGFKSLVYRAELDSELLKRIVSTLSEVTEYAKLGFAMDATSIGNDAASPFQNMFRMSTFSDSVAISTKCNSMGLSLLSIISGIICSRLLSQGVFTRGGIAKGKLIHTDNIIVGEGLITAYKLESSAAIYPRILIAENILADFDFVAGQGGDLDLRRQDFDGLWHLHILHSKLIEMTRATVSQASAAPQPGFMALSKSEIENALRTQRAPDIRGKLGWLARYFNEGAQKFGYEPVVLHAAA